MPVRGVDGVENITALGIADAIAVCIQGVLAPLLCTEAAVRVDGTHRAQHMKVWIRITADAFWHMYAQISDHAAINKFLLNKGAGQFDILLH